MDFWTDVQVGNRSSRFSVDACLTNSDDDFKYGEKALVILEITHTYEGLFIDQAPRVFSIESVKAPCSQ